MCLEVSSVCCSSPKRWKLLFCWRKKDPSKVSWISKGDKYSRPRNLRIWGGFLGQPPYSNYFHEHSVKICAEESLNKCKVPWVCFPGFWTLTLGHTEPLAFIKRFSWIIFPTCSGSFIFLLWSALHTSALTLPFSFKAPAFLCLMTWPLWQFEEKLSFL